MSRDGPAGRPSPFQTNIYIRGLPPDCTADDLYKLCQGFGKILSTKAVVDQEMKRCKGYGFVDFGSAEAANKALYVLNNDGVHHAQVAKEVVRVRNSEKAS